MTYEAWISESAASIRVKVIELEATTERAAFREAQSLCTGTEFVRGIVSVDAEDEGEGA